MKNDHDSTDNIHDFADQISNTKSHIQRCIKFLIKEANKNKYDYGQLRYIFRRVREECGIEVSDNNVVFTQSLPSELNHFLSSSTDL